MKVLLLTNMPSYHQMEFAEAMVAELGIDNFRIAFHKPVSNDRQEMGWVDQYDAPYVLRFRESQANKEETLRWIDNADAVIQGRFPIKHLRSRINAGKLTFAYQERYWKKPFSYLHLISRLPKLVREYWSVNRANYHLLAAGAYTAGDLNGMGLFRNKSWKFGYFINTSESVPRDKNATQLGILWCARICAVKQPHQALKIAAGLKQRKVNFILTMLGDGELKAEIEQAIQNMGLTDEVSCTGWQSSNEVAQQMQAADVFLMTSHRGEGWGMVINEAMSNGCTVVSNQQVGSAPWLIEHGKTGYLYQDQDIEHLIEDLSQHSRAHLLDVGLAGHAAIEHNWSCRVAAQRLISLSSVLVKGDKFSAERLFDDGPCSPA